MTQSARTRSYACVSPAAIWRLNETVVNHTCTATSEVPFGVPAMDACAGRHVPFHHRAALPSPRTPGRAPPAPSSPRLRGGPDAARRHGLPKRRRVPSGDPSTSAPGIGRARWTSRCRRTHRVPNQFSLAVLRPDPICAANPKGYDYARSSRTLRKARSCQSDPSLHPVIFPPHLPPPSSPLHAPPRAPGGCAPVWPARPRRGQPPSPPPRNTCIARLHRCSSRA